MSFVSLFRAASLSHQQRYINTPAEIYNINLSQKCQIFFKYYLTSFRVCDIEAILHKSLIISHLRGQPLVSASVSSTYDLARYMLGREPVHKPFLLPVLLLC